MTNLIYREEFKDLDNPKKDVFFYICSDTKNENNFSIVMGFDFSEIAFESYGSDKIIFRMHYGLEDGSIDCDINREHFIDIMTEMTNSLKKLGLIREDKV